jgi:hypothetical protein
MTAVQAPAAAVPRVLAIVDGSGDPFRGEAIRRRIAALRLHCAEVFVLALDGYDSLEPVVDGTSHAQASSSGLTWSLARDALALARTQRCDVVYAIGAVAHTLASLVGPVLRTPVVAHPLQSIAASDLHAASLCRSSYLVSNASLGREVSATGDSMVTQVADVRRAFRVSAPACGSRDGLTHLGWSGALAAEQGLDFLLEAASTLRRELFWHLFVPEEETAAARRLASRNGLRADIRTLDPGSPAHFEGIDVFVASGWHDVLHVAAGDAWASGIATVVPCIAEWDDMAAVSDAVCTYTLGEGATFLAALARVRARLSTQRRGANAARLPPVDSESAGAMIAEGLRRACGKTRCVA